MSQHPYRGEIVGAFVVSAILLPIETWRRWGELASPWALDDALVCAAAMGVAMMLVRRHRAAPGLWLFVCGGAWFLFVLSLYGSVYSYGEGDPSGVWVGWVIGFKLVGLSLVSWASWRALGRVAGGDPYGAAG